jgi:hypothetical protein
LQLAAEARARKGAVTSFIKGTGRPEEAALATQESVAALFRDMVQQVERNHVTQVCEWRVCVCGRVCVCVVVVLLSFSAVV